jgi:hypothetical protein
MDQHKKRRLSKWAKSLRRDRLLTLTGTLLIFVTFIVKDAIGDNFKDLVAQIDMAQYVSMIRSDAPSTAVLIPATVDERVAWSIQVNAHDKTLLTISSDLAQILPDNDRFLSDIKEYRSKTDQIDVAYLNIHKPNTRAANPQQFAEAVDHLYDDTIGTYGGVLSIYYSILDDARAIKEKRERIANISKWTSYVLFTIGWSIAFYGQLSGKGGKANTAEG